MPSSDGFSADSKTDSPAVHEPAADNSDSNTGTWNTPRILAASAAIIAGVVIYLVGLPGGSNLIFDTTVSDFTLPVALFVGGAGVAAAGWSATSGRWRVVDIVVASVLGVAGGLVFSVWNVTSAGFRNAMPQPASAIVVGMWLFPAVLGALIVRRPGAGVYTEVVAAVLSALAGNEWGFSTVWYGLVEGLGAEVVFAVLLYRRFGLPTALVAGAGAGVAVGLMDTLIYYPKLDVGGRVAYVAIAILSGVVIAGLGSWALTKALAVTGTLAPLRSGRVTERV